MKDANKYPISFPYGATSPPYTATHPHRGDDRACPAGTPVIISGVTIGLTGATGKVTGPHLHIQEWRNNYLDVRKPQNAFKPGVVTLVDPNQTVGDGSFGKFVTVKNSDGWSDSYCHLSKILVKLGDKLNVQPQEDDVKPTHDQITQIFRDYLGNEPSSDQIAHYLARPISVLYFDALKSVHDHLNRVVKAKGDVK